MFNGFIEQVLPRNQRLQKINQIKKSVSNPSSNIKTSNLFKIKYMKYAIGIKSIANHNNDLQTKIKRQRNYHHGQHDNQG